jgi:hypothetical protein
MSDPFWIRPNPLPPDLEREPVQLDPTLNEGRASPFKVVAAMLATALIVMLVLFGLTREAPDQQTASVPEPTTPPAATGAGTSGQGSVTPQPRASNPTSTGRPIPQEQDPIEQNTRP